MKQLIEFPLEGGGSIVVEVEQEVAGVTRAARPGEIAAKATATFEDAIDHVRPVANSLVGKLRDLADAPDEVEVQFGLKLSAEAGALVASAATEANFSIKLSWKSKA